MANSVGPDQTPRSAASDLGLHCLLRRHCPNTSHDVASTLMLLYINVTCPLDFGRIEYFLIICRLRFSNSLILTCIKVLI